MTEKDNQLMEKYGITVVRETVYIFNGTRYSELRDALRYARMLTEGTKEVAVPRKKSTPGV